MLHGMEMFGGMPVLGRIAASHVTACETEPQMNPGITRFHALFTHMFAGLTDLDLIEMRTLVWHGVLPTKWCVK